MTDQAGGTTSQQFLEQVIGSQTIDLPRLPAKVPYGFGPEKLEVAGGASGQQVGLQATPSKVCQLSGLRWGSSSTGNATTSADLVIGGVGTCTVTATQPGTNDYTKAAEVTRTFSSRARPLTDHSRRCVHDFWQPNAEDRCHLQRLCQWEQQQFSLQPPHLRGDRRRPTSKLDDSSG